MNILIIGAGVIGQVFGAHLSRSGHKVTFLVREKHLEYFENKGITVYCEGALIPYSCSEYLEIRDCAFVTQLPDLTNVDYVFVTTRTEQRTDVAKLLDNCDLSDSQDTQIAICFPFWSQSSLDFAQKFSACHYILPGVTGVYRDDTKTTPQSPYVFRGVTLVSPLFNTTWNDTNRLRSVFSHAKLPSATKSNLVTIMDIIMAVSFPFFAAISTQNYKAEALRDKVLTSLAVKAQKDCLRILHAGSVSTGAVGKMLLAIPTTVQTSLVTISPIFLKGLTKEMVEVHFKKVHNQTIFLLKELLSFPFAQKVKHDSLERLLAVVQ